MDTRRKHIVFGSIAMIMAIVSLWYIFNPSNRFGLSVFGITTYNRIPYILSDIQVRTDGTVRRIQRTHLVQQAEIHWLLESLPDVVIIATGWSGETDVSLEIHQLTPCAVEVHKTLSALFRYNQLKNEGKKVAIHVHSTC